MPDASIFAHGLRALVADHRPPPEFTPARPGSRQPGRDPLRPQLAFGAFWRSTFGSQLFIWKMVAAYTIFTADGCASPTPASANLGPDKLQQDSHDGQGCLTGSHCILSKFIETLLPPTVGHLVGQVPGRAHEGTRFRSCRSTESGFEN